MKKLTQSLVIIALTVGSIGLANAQNDFVAGNNSSDTKICIIAAEGNRLKLLKELQDTGMSKRYVAEKIQCNELSFVDFVEQYGNNVDKINNFITNGKYSKNIIVASVAAR
jgi:hypothetical protein